MEIFKKLIKSIKEHTLNYDEDTLKKAYLYSKEAHKSQIRESGEPYFHHPVEVAKILINLRLDNQTIVTALLHDTVEDTEITLEDIKLFFGSEIAKLVDGVTKLTRLEIQSEKTRQAENFRKLVIAMSSDIRVLLIKLADRLHNMRTLQHINDHKKKLRIAQETMDIYAPLAERIGMNSLKDELEDLSFSILDQDTRLLILSRFHHLYGINDGRVLEIISQLENDMKESDVHSQVTGRKKTPYSIFKKMQTKNVSFEQLSDIMAFRVVVKTIQDCYQVLGIFHSKYLVIPGRFKDYISTPKSNGYQSLHTTLIGPINQRIEIQIRTYELHQIAEFGLAAHWNYKQQEWLHDGKRYSWIRSLLEILEKADNPEEFLEHTKLEMYQDQVFCFTPKGAIIILPCGSTVIDFAYSVHSYIGNHAVSARINGKQVPLRTILNNGDQVEILTSKNQTPSPTWERFVITGKAKANIRRFIRNQHNKKFFYLGKNIILKFLSKEGIAPEDKNFELIKKKYKLNTIDDLFIKIGSGEINIHDINPIFSNHSDRVKNLNSKSKAKNELIYNDKISLRRSLASFSSREWKVNGLLIPIKGLASGIPVHLSKCCYPLLGERIAGTIVNGKGIIIHIINCRKLINSYNTNEVIHLSWDQDKCINQIYISRLKIIFVNEIGSLALTTTAISKYGGNIVNLKITSRTVDFWHLLIDIEVKDIEHLSKIKIGLKSLLSIIFVERVMN